MADRNRPSKPLMGGLPLRNSIASQLFLVVLLAYLAVSVAITSAQIAEIYTRANNDLSRELEILGRSFRGSLAKALWEFDEESLKSSIRGLQGIPGVLGVTVQDINTGELHGTSSEDGSGATGQGELSNLIKQEFDIFFEIDGRNELVGHANVYSHRDVVLDRIKYSVLVVVLSEILKIVAIWGIFLWISHRMLGRPLAVLTTAAERLSKEDLKDFKVDIHADNRNELKLLEEAFNLSAAKLYEAKDELENRMRLALSAGRIATWVWHPEDDRLEFDDHLPSIFGQTSEIFGHSFGNLQQFICDDDRAAFVNVMNESIINREPVHTDFQVNAADGSVLHVEVQAIVILTGDDVDAPHMVGTAMDITERKQSEVNLERAIAAAERANNAKSEFLASMSHELRTPLNAILGFSDVIREQYLGPLGVEKYREYATDIHNSGRFLLELVGELLDLSAIEAGKIKLHKETIDLSKIVDDCVRTVAEKAGEKKIELGSKQAGSNVTACVDRRAIKQVVLNILSNAVKFTGEGGAVKIASSRDEHGAYITVTDNGPGIQSDQLAEITAPFTRGESDPLLAEKGWGLGLSISRSLVELHDGELEIESEPGKGTTVTVSLPDEEAD